MITLLHQTALPHAHPHVEALLLAAFGAVLLGLGAMAWRRFKA